MGKLKPAIIPKYMQLFLYGIGLLSIENNVKGL